MGLGWYSPRYHHQTVPAPKQKADEHPSSFVCTRCAGNDGLNRQNRRDYFGGRTLNLLAGRSSSSGIKSLDILSHKQTDSGGKCVGDSDCDGHNDQNFFFASKSGKQFPRLLQIVNDRSPDPSA